MSESHLLIEGIHCTRKTLDTIHHLTRLSRGKFSDKGFEEFFCRMITRDVATIDFLLQGMLGYLKAIASPKPFNTIHTLIEEAVRSHRSRLDQKKIRITNTFAEDLPEPSVPEPHLKYVLNSILEYATASISPGGGIDFLTILPSPEKGDTGDGQDIEIRVTLTGHHRVEGLDLGLRLIREMVQRNRGSLHVEWDEAKKKAGFLIRFPMEQRRGMLSRAFP